MKCISCRFVEGVATTVALCVRSFASMMPPVVRWDRHMVETGHGTAMVLRHDGTVLRLAGVLHGAGIGLPYNCHRTVVGPP